MRRSAATRCNSPLTRPHRPAFAGRFIVWESSGSSGEPGLFVGTARPWAFTTRSKGLRRRRCSLAPLVRPCAGRRIASSARPAGTSRAPSRCAASSACSRLRPARLRARLPAAAAGLVAALNAQSPTVLATYPSAALLLAGEARARRLRVTLAEVWTGGETLGAAARAEIRRPSAARSPTAGPFLNSRPRIRVRARCAAPERRLGAARAGGCGRPPVPPALAAKVWLPPTSPTMCSR